MHILMVEDSGTLASLFEAQARRLGHQVVSAGTKVAALAAFEKATFDLVFIDMGLEGLHDRGLEILAEMKAQKPDQRIGILSSNDLRDMVRESQQKGAEFYMVKPFTLEGLSIILSDDKTAIRTYQPGIGEGRIILLDEMSR